MKEDDLQQDLGRLLRDPFQTSDISVAHAMAATACLYRSFDLLADEINERTYSISRFDFKQFMRLDAAAVSAMHLFPEGFGGSNYSFSLPSDKIFKSFWFIESMSFSDGLSKAYEMDSIAT